LTPVSARAALVSPRVELARVALTAALAVDGVVAGNTGPGGFYVTGEGPGQLAGVVAVAEPEGRYSIDLYVTAGLVPLHALGDAVRARVHEAAAAAGMADRLGQVGVAIIDVAEPRA
jgi:hypothetical protein